MDNKNCFLLVNGNGDWARGSTAKESVDNIKKISPASGTHVLYLVTGDDTAEVTSDGRLATMKGAQVHQVAKFRSRPSLIEFAS